MLDITALDNKIRLAPLGIHYGIVHEALLKGEKGWAFRFARPLLNQSDASTQWYVGLMHHTGSGAEKNLATAHHWYQKSAAQGFGAAKGALAIIGAAERNEEVNRNALRCPPMDLVYKDIARLRCFEREREVIFWEYQRSADLGDGEMQILLGMCYEKGIHVPRHWETAVEWYRRAAVQGLDSGYAFYKKLVWNMEGEESAWDQLETQVVCELARTSILKGPEPANEVDAYRWCLDAAQKGDRYACWRLHEIYLQGQGVEVDREKSAKWLTVALIGRLKEPIFSYADMVLGDLERTLNEQTTLLALRSEMRARMSRPEGGWGRVQLRPIGVHGRVGLSNPMGGHSHVN